MHTLYNKLQKDMEGSKNLKTQIEKVKAEWDIVTYLCRFQIRSESGGRYLRKTILLYSLKINRGIVFLVVWDEESGCGSVEELLHPIKNMPDIIPFIPS